MTLYDIYSDAMNLLGYGINAATITGNDELLKPAVSSVNLILKDITGGETTISRITDDINCDNAVAEALTYGIAMFLALGEGDTGRQQMFCDLYNQKRAKCKSGITFVTDKMPYSAL